MHILAHALAGRGERVHVLSVARNQKASDRADGDVWVHRRPFTTPRGVGRIARMPETYDRLQVAWSAWRAWRALGTRFDVVHTPQWRAQGLAFALRRPLPLVVYLHSLASQILGTLERTGPDARLAERLEAAAVRRADLVGSPREHAGAVSGILRLDPSRLRIVPNPVRPRPAAPPAPEGPARVLFAGRFEPRKAPETIVLAAPRVLAEFPGARFVFVGRDASTRRRPSYRAWLETLARERGILDSIEFVDGWQAGAVERETARAQVCVVPSTSESFGYVAAEASSAGRPVVASRAGGLAEVVEDGVSGLLARPGDAAEWGEAVSAILREPARARAMGEAGRRLMAERFHPDAVAASMIEVYREAIDRFRHAEREAAGVR